MKAILIIGLIGLIWIATKSSYECKIKEDKWRDELGL